MEDIAYKIAMLETEVLFYKMMTGCLAKTLATDENDVVDKELYRQIQVNASNHVVVLINQDSGKAQDWVNRNVFDFRTKIDMEMKND
jgi:hypothetical protein